MAPLTVIWGDLRGRTIIVDSASWGECGDWVRPHNNNNNNNNNNSESLNITRVSWTVEMLKDLEECCDNAKNLHQGDNAPL